MNTCGMLNSYLKRIFDVARHGDAREESYYSGLEELIKNCAESSGKKKTHVTTLPKKTEAGNPDFRIWDGQHSIVGYIEAKPPTEENLDHIEETAQHTIGGYQVLDKWLKDRKGRRLSLEDICHYCRVATAVQSTIGIQEDLDNLYAKIEPEIIPVPLDKR